MYFGAAASREIIKKYEFYYPKEKPKKLKKKEPSPSNEEKKQSRIKFDVLLTSYEMINMDSAVLKNIEWECLVLLFLHVLSQHLLSGGIFVQLCPYITCFKV
jgi:chromodomain-helicase-DNA-binding protein 4